MNTENDTEQRQQQALHMTEPGADITEEQLQAVVSDEELRADLQQMTDLRVAMQRAHDGCDVEQRLQQFHQTHPFLHPSASRFPLLRYIAAAVAAAAVFAGILYYVSLPTGDTPHHPSSPTPLFTADTQQQGISLTDEKGQQVTLSPRTKQHTQLSLNDFRRVISDTAHIEKVTLHVPYGKSADITLPDGTLCYLHPGSRVIFPTAFSSSRRREVILDGEAYFKVAQHKGQPFVVHTPRGDVRDYGTEFNVNTRDPEAGVGVVLVSGKVGITPNGGSEVMIRPGQKCTIRARAGQPADDTGQQQCFVSEADLTPYEMWRDGYLYLDNVALRDIMLAIGQNFNMTVEFRDTAALGLKMRFMAERNNGVEAALRMVNSMGKASATCNGRRIILEELKN